MTRRPGETRPTHPTRPADPAWSPSRLLDLWGLGDESFEILARSVVIPRRNPARDDRRRMAGDRLIVRPDFTETWHVDAALPAARLWPWLAQMMRGAGVYGWTRLEGPGWRSATSLLPFVGAARVGDRVEPLLELCVVEEGSEVVWRSVAELEILGARLPSLTLDYRSIPRGCGARLAARLRCTIEPGPRPLGLLAARLLSYMLPGCQVRALVQHALAAEVGSARVEPPADARFQHAIFTPAPDDAATGPDAA